MAKLIAYGRVSPAGLLSWAPGREMHTTWDDLGAGRAGEFGIPRLRASHVFDEPFSRFGRMDPLCKVAVAAAQLALKSGENLAGIKRDDVAQVGGTMLGCMEVDAQFEATRRAGAPSPALFVYTLPSMFQGEIAIRYGLRGRCTLLSNGELSAMTALATGVRWIEKGRAPAVLVVAAEAAGPAAANHDRNFTPQSAAAAWLLCPGSGLAGASFDGEADGAQALTNEGLGYGMSFVDALEPLLLSGAKARVTAEVEGRRVSLDLG